MPRRRLVLSSCALALALLAPASATSAQVLAGSERREPALTSARVLAISVDGFNVAAIKRLGPAQAPTLHRLLAEGASTLNARTAYEQNVTLPNHAGMMTSRRIKAAQGGHGVTWDDERPLMTVQKAAGHPVDSVFSVVHRAGGSTALFSTKDRFGLYERSWPADISRFEVDANQARLVRTATADLLDAGRPFTFLHLSLPDRFGHQYGGLSQRYLAAVRKTDRQLGTVLAAIDAHPDLAEQLTVILTADHGFMPGRTTHTPRVLADYRIPFLAWGAQVRAGDLYDLNDDYANPRKTHPTYKPVRQPVRNADLGNLATDLLGLGPIPGSELDAAHDLDVD